MTAEMKAIAEQVKEAFPEGVQEIREFRGEITVVVDAQQIVEICTFCRDTEGLQFSLLADLAGIDYYPEEPRFAINYMLFSMPLNHMLRLKAYVHGDEAKLPSVTGVWAGANWPEREVYDMFGVEFEKHPNMQRILMPVDWTGHPHRKDYPLGYEEVQFSFNADRVMENKPQPKE